MNTHDLLYVGGAVRPLDKILKTNACYEAGFLGSNFQDWAENENQKIRDKARLHYVQTKHIREAARVSEESIGLSKAAKVGQHRKRVNLLAKSIHKGAQRALEQGSLREREGLEGQDNFDTLYALTERNSPRVLPLKHELVPSFTREIIPTSLHIQHRKWTGEYRGQVVVQTPASNAPDANAGERFTERLTKRAVSKIFESGAYVAQCHEGFTTFITPTFSREQRMALFGSMSEAEGRPYTPVTFERDLGDLVYGKDGPYTLLPKQPFKIIKTLETTIGREMSRLLSGMKKMYQRGWDTSEGEKVEPHYKAMPTMFGPDRDKADFHYMWVAECPMNEDGEPNPHVHLMVRWTVERKHFDDWAARIESLWGHGVANIQRIKQPKAASTYLIKAIGYAAKGGNADQGLIRGNRYGLAKCSRAPAWETLATFDTDNITAIIKELGYKLEQWKAPQERALRRVQAKKKQTVKALSIAKNQLKPESILKKMESAIIRHERAALKISQGIKSRDMAVSSKNRFSITFTGDEAKARMDEFLFWAAGARGWSMNLSGMPFEETFNGEPIKVFKKPDWLDCTDIKRKADDRYQDQYQAFLDKRAYWQSVLASSPIPEPDENEIAAMLNEKYQLLGTGWHVRQAPKQTENRNE